MKTSLEIKLPPSLNDQVYEYQISPHHKLHELLVGSEKDKRRTIKEAASEAIVYGMKRYILIWGSILEDEDEGQIRVTQNNSFDEDCINQFGISYEAELYRLRPDDKRFFASPDVSHQDLIRTIARITYENLWRQSFTFEVYP